MELIAVVATAAVDIMTMTTTPSSTTILCQRLSWGRGGLLVILGNDDNCHSLITRISISDGHELEALIFNVSYNVFYNAYTTPSNIPASWAFQRHRSAKCN